MSAHRHTALIITSLKRSNCSSILCNTITGINAGRNCMLLCKLTMCSSLTIFLRLWFTRILVIRIQNLWQYVSNMEYFPLSWKIWYLLYQFNIPYFMESYIFIFTETEGKIICVFAYTVTSNVWQEKISSPKSVIRQVTSACLKYGGKYNLCKLVIIRMIRLPWHIQMFRRIVIRSAMKY